MLCIVNVHGLIFRGLKSFCGTRVRAVVLSKWICRFLGALKLRSIPLSQDEILLRFDCIVSYVLYSGRSLMSLDNTMQVPWRQVAYEYDAQ